MSDDSGPGLSRRQTIAAGTSGLIAAMPRESAGGRPEGADGTPEQIHLSWADDPARSVVVSWASPGQAVGPRVRIGQRVIPAAERAVPAVGGAVSWTYHARVDGLRPGATYAYAVTGDNDANAADPFSATFTTAPDGRAAFRFTSFGDLAAPGTGWRGLASRVGYAVGAVETFQPLFHLLNGDLTEAGPVPDGQPEAWRDLGNQVQTSAAYRPWLPVPGGHGVAAGLDDQAAASFLTRYTLPPNGADGLDGRWYAFRVGTALFVCLSGDDVAYEGASARGYSGGAQTSWLEATLAAARGDASVDWIVVQLHQCACSSGAPGSVSDLGIRREWLPLFDTYEVDLVLSGHDHGYERSFPVRGCDPGAGTDTLTGATVDTRRPHPVTAMDSGVFDTSQGTVHLVLGCGGTTNPTDPTAPPAALRTARVLTRPAGPVPGARVPGDEVPGRVTDGGGAGPDGAGPGAALPGGDAVEAAPWSARRVDAPGYAIAVFDVSPGSEAGGQTSVTVCCYRAAGPDPLGRSAGEPGEAADDYAVFEAFTLVRPRSDGRRWHPRPLAAGWATLRPVP